MDWSEGDVTVDGGVRLHYYRAGSGVPVVLAHGATDNGRCWDRFAHVLADSYEVVAFDARNHGKSDAPDRGPIGGGDDLVALTETLSLDRPAIIGHSMGGRTVAQAASQRPELFRCAVLEDPPWWEEAPAITRTAIDFSAMTAEEITVGGRQQNPGWHADEFPAWAESKKQFRPTAEWMKGVPGMGASWRELAGNISIPALLVCGESGRGGIVTPAVAAEACRRAQAMESVKLDAGHNVRREAFEPFVEAVTTFLQQNM